MGADLRAHAYRDFQIRLAANSQIVFFGAHAAAEAQLADHYSRFSPGTSNRPRHSARKDHALVATLPYPGTRGSEIQRCDGQFSRFQAAVAQNLCTVAWVGLR